MRLSVFTLMIVLGPLHAADEDKAFYPLKVGTKSTYRINGQDDKFVLTVTKEEKVGDQQCFVLEAALKDKVLATEHVAILKDGVYRFKMNDNVIEPPICFFKSAAKKGDSWKQDFKVAGAMATAKFELDIENVEVPAGKYTDARVIRGEVVENDTSIKSTMWIVKGVGMVKQTYQTGAQTITLELEKVE